MEAGTQNPCSCSLGLERDTPCWQQQAFNTRMGLELLCMRVGVLIRCPRTARAMSKGALDLPPGLGSASPPSLRSKAAGWPLRPLLQPAAPRRRALDQLRDHTGKKRRYWLVLKEIIRAAPCFFLHVLAWY
jgi:hypothetical protein